MMAPSGGSGVGRPKPGGSLCASASCREWSIHDRGGDVGAAPAPTATNWGFPFVPNADLVSAQICSKREFGFSAGNTSAQLVPRVFSLGSSSSCCTLVTMLTIYPVVHHVMKKASNCVYIPFIHPEKDWHYLHGNYHPVPWCAEILFCTFGSSHYCFRVHTVAVTLFTHPIIIKLHCENVLLGATLSKIFSDGGQKIKAVIGIGEGFPTHILRL